MLLKEKTKTELGIDIDSLSQGSHKKVYAQCDYCKSDYLVQFKNRNGSYKKFPKDCCIKCKFKKREEVSLATHGVKNSAQREDVKEKLRTFNIEDYIDQIRDLASKGFSSYKISQKLNIPSTSLERFLESTKLDFSVVKNNRGRTTKAAMIDKYGLEYKKILADKLRIMSNKLYAVDNYFQSEEIKEKSKQTNLEKFREDHWNKVEKLKKRGSENTFSKEETKSKIKSTNLEIYGHENPNSSIEIKDKSKQTRINNGNEYSFEGISIKDMCDITGYSITRMRDLIKMYGHDAAIKMSPFQSSLESAIEEFIISLDLSYEKQFKVESKSCDFKVNNILIECDGLYWHTEKNLEINRKVDGQRYHFQKRELYKKHGYRSYFFRSDEIENKLPIVKSIIINALSLNSVKFYARKLTFQELTNKEGYEFCQEHHLMGGHKTVSKTFALMNGNIALSVFQVKRLGNGKGYDLSRFCTLPETTIVGGFSKLLSGFEKISKPNRFQTFIDLRYGSGDYLEKLGFSQESCSPSFNWTNGVETFHRMKFPASTGYDYDMVKIWDCGQRKMVKNY